jgi:L-aspartate oxidase
MSEPKASEWRQRMTLRAVPEARPLWSRDADVVVVGSGAAGMTAALVAAARGRRVLLVTKGELGAGSTAYAQGGMAVVHDESDSFRLHASDTLAAGAGLCDPAAVSAMVCSAPEVISWLTSLGARFGHGHLEGGHSRHRIVHAGGDAIGAEVHRVLAAALLASTVTVLPHTIALNLADGGLLVGRNGPELAPGLLRTPAVVLATGGFGQAFATTTNPPGVTGDGLALAARAGAEVRDVEFTQFHPTVLWSADAKGQCPLITEALRGAGAVIVDDRGRAVLAGRDLAPRDVVSAAMHAWMAETGADCLWLDARMAGRRTLERSFPTVTAACRARGIDPVTDPIPVAPGAHYACGGVRADMSGRTSVPGLFAVGEVACTGVHGANRLASNSLTEAMIMGRRVGELLGRDLPGLGVRAGTSGPVGVAASARRSLAVAMSRGAGVLRDRAGLERLLGALDSAPGCDRLDLATVEATNLHTVSTLVARAALARRESRGCHRRADAMYMEGDAA